MPGPLTYAAITLLARDRIGQIRRALSNKKAAGTAHELELHVLELATQAEAMMKATEPVIEPPVRMYGPPLTDQVSRFLLLGAIGPDLPRYGAYFNPGQRWLFDTLHKGTPDGDRERVLANTTNLVFDFWTRVGPLIDGSIKDQDKAKAAKQQMQAYVLGHLCHIAADVLSHPYFESIEARLADSTVTPTVRLMTRDDVAGAFDVRIADKFFGRGTDTHTKKWADWFPTPGDVPAAFGQAMADSITFIYGARAEGLPAFEEAFKKIDPAPLPLSADLIRESIDYFRTIVEIERVWTLADWLGATAAMFLPLGFAYFGALALPIGKDLTRPLTPADGDDAPARRTYESIVYPVAVSSLGPLVSMIIVSASGRGLRAEGVTGWIQAGLSIVASIGFFATLGGAGGARWTLWFALPLALAVAQIIFVLARGARENSRKLLFVGPLVQVLLALVFMLLYHVWLHDGVEELQKDSDKRNNLSAFGDFAAWLGIVAVLWFVHALLWRYVFSSSTPDDQNVFANGGPRQFLRLYDDMELIHDAKKDVTSDRLTDLSYPPARRELFKIWWQAGTAAGVQVNIKHDRLEFHWPAPAGIVNQVVFAPIAPITIERYGEQLAKAITLDGTRGTLHVSPARDDEKDLELAPGAMFSDNGDDQTTVALHDTEAAKFKDVGTSDATAFTIFHAKRPSLAIAMGRSGAAAARKRERSESKPGCLLKFVSGRLYRSDPATDGTSPMLRRLFSPGDAIEITPATGPKEQRIVEQVPNETDVLVSSTFTTTIPAAGIPFARAASDRGVRLAKAAQVQIAPFTAGIGPNTVQVVVPPPPSPPNAAPAIGAQFRVGDVVEFARAENPGEVFARRTITAIHDPEPIVVAIVGGGAVGAATFTTQVGAGPVSPARPTGAAVLVEGTSITIYFISGNYAGGDTWTITPGAAVVQPATNTSTGFPSLTPRLILTLGPAAGAVGTANFSLRIGTTEAVIVTIDGAGSLGASTFHTQVGASPVSPTAATGVDVAVSGTLATLTFSSGNYVAGDSWTISAEGNVHAAATNTSTGTPKMGPVIGYFTTASSVPILGTLTTLFFSSAGVFNAGDHWIVDPDVTVTPHLTAGSTGTMTAQIEPRLVELDAAPPPFSGWAFLDRLSDDEADGFAFVADASDVFGDSESVMNDAADFAALLCLGAASRMAPNNAPATPERATKPIHRVSQVFRNWNLDRRRVDEWKTIVSGGAASERRGDFQATEEAVSIDPLDAGEQFTDAFVEQRRAADTVVRDLGWLGVFRAWVDMAGRSRTDTTSDEVFRPGTPSNRDLSRAMAYLIDASEGVTP